MLVLDENTKFEDFKVLGNPDVHDQSGKEIVLGKTDFAADHFTGHKYFGALKSSTIMKGTIKSIDTSEAMKIPGVKAVITYEDLPLLWSPTITRYGQEVAGVVADNFYTAVRATQAVKIEYEEATDGVFDPDVAMIGKDADGNPVSSGIVPGNIMPVITLYRNPDMIEGVGADPGFELSDYVKEYKFPWSNSYTHNCLEAHQTLAWWIGDDMYFYTGTQDINYIKSYIVLAKYMPGYPSNKIHGVTHFNCGGYGGKSLDCLVPQALAMSKKVGGYPVLCKNTRQQNNMNRGRTFACTSTIKLGVKKVGNDFKFEACDAKFYSDGGHNTATPCGDVHWGLRTTYTIPYATMKTHLVFTNSTTRHYWRCVNDPPGAMNYDTAIEKLAYDLRDDMGYKGTPYDLRVSNMRTQEMGDQDFGNSGVSNYYAYGLHYSKYWGAFAIKDLYEKAYEASGYKTKWHDAHTKTVDDLYHNGDTRWHGIAITGHHDSHGVINGGSQRGGIIRAHDDGTFTVLTGSARGCSGGTTVCCNVVAEVLGVSADKVKLGDWGNTDTTLPGGVQAGSSHTVSISTTFYNTAVLLRWKIFNAAMAHPTFYGQATSVDDFDVEDGVIFLKKNPEVRAPYATILAKNAAIAASSNGWEIEETYTGMGPMLGKFTGYYAETENNTDQFGRIRGGAWRSKGNYLKRGDYVTCNGAAAAACEVAVDPETGEVEILHYWNVVDAGTVMFRKGAEKEIAAGAECAHNMAFFFGDIYDEKYGKLLSTQYTEAMMPTYMDMKTEDHDLILYESRDVGGPFGCHGIAEPCVTNYVSVFLAIYNAIGVWINPEKGNIGPDRVLKSIKRATKDGYSIDKIGARVK